MAHDSAWALHLLLSTAMSTSLDLLLEASAALLSCAARSRQIECGKALRCCAKEELGATSARRAAGITVAMVARRICASERLQGYSVQSVNFSAILSQNRNSFARYATRHAQAAARHSAPPSPRAETLRCTSAQAVQTSYPNCCKKRGSRASASRGGRGVQNCAAALLEATEC